MQVLQRRMGISDEMLRGAFSGGGGGGGAAAPAAAAAPAEAAPAGVCRAAALASHARVAANTSLLLLCSLGDGRRPYSRGQACWSPDLHCNYFQDWRQEGGGHEGDSCSHEPELEGCTCSREPTDSCTSASSREPTDSRTSASPAMMNRYKPWLLRYRLWLARTSTKKRPTSGQRSCKRQARRSRSSSSTLEENEMLPTYSIRPCHPCSIVRCHSLSLWIRSID